MKNTLACIGVGHMASAILQNLKGFDICLYDIDRSKYASFPDAKTASSAAEAVSAADIVLLAVVPQAFGGLLAELKSSGADLTGKLFISIAAGVKMDAICRGLEAELPVVRVMPNSGILIGKGVTALCRNALVTDEMYACAKAVFAGGSVCFDLQEEEMNAIISVTSSAPAYVYMLIKAIRDAAKSQGLEQDLTDIICRMVIGSAETALQSDKSPEELIAAVATKGGTTAEAVKVLQEHDLDGIMDQAMKACTKRAAELSALYD